MVRLSRSGKSGCELHSPRRPVRARQKVRSFDSSADAASKWPAGRPHKKRRMRIPKNTGPATMNSSSLSPGYRACCSYFPDLTPIVTPILIRESAKSFGIVQIDDDALFVYRNFDDICGVRSHHGARANIFGGFFTYREQLLIQRARENHGMAALAAIRGNHDFILVALECFEQQRNKLPRNQRMIDEADQHSFCFFRWQTANRRLQ